MSSRLREWMYGACAVVAVTTLGCGGEKESGTANTAGGSGGVSGGGGGGLSGEGGASGGAGGESPDNTGGVPATTGGAGPGGTGPGGSGAGGAPAVCDQTPCEGIDVFGQTAPPCCMSATACGVDLGGNCLDPQVLEQFGADGGGFDFGDPEVIISDPACAGTTIDVQGTAIELDGCCDPAGVCGFSTENLDFGGGGFSFPTMCVTNADAQALGQGGGLDAGPEVACAYPADGSAPAPVGDGG